MWDDPELLSVVVMLELLGLLVPQVVLHHVDQVVVVVIQILLWVTLVRNLGARSLERVQHESSLTLFSL